MLLLVNFSMDFLSLFITMKLLREKMSILGTVAASAFGAVLGSAAVILLPDSRILDLIFGIVSSMLMMRLLLGRGKGFLEILRASLIMWGVGVMLGGLFVFLSEKLKIPDGKKNIGFASIFVPASLASCLVIRLLQTSSSNKKAEVEISFFDYTVTVTGLCDSGSSLIEPISGLPVILVSSAAVPPISNRTPEELAENGLRVRMIPVKTVNGETVAVGFVPHSVSINGRKTDAVIAVDKNNTEYSGCEAIIPARLIPAGRVTEKD